MATAQESYFPFELQLEIIEHLWNDLTSLSVCSLVSSQWSEYARILLFSNVQVDILVGFTEVDVQERLTKFMELLHAPQSRLGKYIQYIYIEGPDNLSTDESQKALPSEYDELSSILWTILPCVPCVRKLVLATVTWYWIPQDIKVLLGSLSKVVSLAWYKVSFECMDELMLFSSESFSELQTLSVERLRVKTVSQNRLSMFTQQLLRFASLRTLDVYVDASTAPLLYALSSYPDFPNFLPILDTLEFYFYEVAVLDAINSILRAAGPTLRVLELGICIPAPFPGVPYFELLPALRQMAKLKSLHFNENTHPSTFWCFQNILCTTSSAMLKLEKIHLWISRIESRFDYLSLERALLGQNAPSMKVVIHPNTNWGWQPPLEIVETLGHLMPELSKRGLLHFQDWDSNPKQL